MGNFDQVFQTIIVVFGLVMVGAGVRAAQWLRPEDAKRIFPPLINNVFLPAVIFNGIKKTRDKPISPEVLKVSLIALLVIVFCGLMAWSLGRILKLQRRQMGAFILTATFGSTGFVGLPLVKGIYGDKGILPHAFYSEIGSLTLLVTMGVIIASFYGEGGRFGWQTLLAIPRSGPFIGLVLALIFYKDDLPTFITATLDTLGAVTLPLMMFLVGVTIVWKNIGSILPSIIALNLIKLLVSPIIAIVLAKILLQDDQMAQGVILLNASTPAIILCLAYANQYKLDEEFTSAAVFSSFFFSLPTILLMTALFLPR
ncbi:AEC family transporter [Candidatus Chlorohelix sp.]|uniref:AEC family transporter n=1 Tax=Candidatus Chlorohelix sp. TaxID=3139201 RepID=UPI003062EFDD